MRPEDSPYICWIDLETSGNRPSDHILEIGAILTDREMNEVDHKFIVVRTDPAVVEAMDPFVQDMHTKNGLIEDALNSRVMLEAADWDMKQWIRTFTSGDHIPLAGSGVAHFDRQYISKDLPGFNRFLSYWVYDTGVIRRTMKLFGIDVSRADTTDDKTHRAPDDITAHIEEMRRYREIFLEWDRAGLRDAVRRGPALDSAGQPV